MKGPKSSRYKAFKTKNTLVSNPEIIAMVTCTKCGTENVEGAEYCVSCGAALYPKERERRRDVVWP